MGMGIGRLTPPRAARGSRDAPSSPEDTLSVLTRRPPARPLPYDRDAGLARAAARDDRASVAGSPESRNDGS